MKIYALVMIAILSPLVACAAHTHESNELHTHPKQTSPININYKVSGQPIIGSPITINVIGEGHSELSGYDIQLSARYPKGELLSSTSENTAGILNLVVTPKIEGINYVYVYAKTQRGSEMRFKNISIPINVLSNRSRAQSKQVWTQPIPDNGKGQRIIIMPSD